MIIRVRSYRSVSSVGLSFFIALTLSAAFSTPALAELRVESSIHSIGLEYDTPSDSNENASATVRYRREGQPDWQDGLPLFRINYGGKNMLAGSVLFLDPGTKYEIELQISEPDGQDEILAISQ